MTGDGVRRYRRRIITQTDGRPVTRVQPAASGAMGAVIRLGENLSIAAELDVTVTADGRYHVTARATDGTRETFAGSLVRVICPACGGDASRSEGWTSGRCDACQVDGVTA